MYKLYIMCRRVKPFHSDYTVYMQPTSRNKLSEYCVYIAVLIDQDAIRCQKTADGYSVACELNVHEFLLSVNRTSMCRSTLNNYLNDFIMNNRQKWTHLIYPGL